MKSLCVMENITAKMYVSTVEIEKFVLWTEIVL